MIANHAQFLDAILQKMLIRIAFYSEPDAGTVDRECAPLDYGPDPGSKDAMNRYWIYDFASKAESNPLGLLPGQIVSVNVLGKEFDPEKLGLAARSWCVPRDWGIQAPLNGQSSSGKGATK